MKKILLIAFVFINAKCLSQGGIYPMPYQALGSINIAVRDTGGLIVSQTLVPPVYHDTINANTKAFSNNISQVGYAKNYWGSLIIAGDSLYIRDSTKRFWINVSRGVIVPPSLQNLQQVLSVGQDAGGQPAYNFDYLNLSNGTQLNQNNLVINGIVSGNSVEIGTDSIIGSLKVQLPTAPDHVLGASVNGMPFDKYGNVNIAIGGGTVDSVSAGNTYGLNAVVTSPTLNPHITYTLDTTLIVPFTDTSKSTGIASKYYVNSRGFLTAIPNLTQVLTAGGNGGGLNIGNINQIQSVFFTSNNTTLTDGILELIAGTSSLRADSVTHASASISQLPDSGGMLLRSVNGIVATNKNGNVIIPAGAGTVTSVSSGYGTNFSTITNTGSIIVDSSKIMPKNDSGYLYITPFGLASKGYITGISTLTNGYGISGSSFNGTSPQTWTADTTSSNALVSKTRLINSNYFVRSGDSASFTWYPTQTVYHGIPANGIYEFDSSNILMVRNSLNKTYGISTALISSNGTVRDSLPNESGIFLFRVDSTVYYPYVSNPLGYITSSSALSPTSFTSGSVIFRGAAALSQNNSKFFYDSANNQLRIGVTSSNYGTPSQTPFNAIGNVNNYFQYNIQNTNTGVSASEDFVVTGADSTKFGDFGQANGSDPTFTIATPNDNYLYSQSGNLAIGTAANKYIRFFNSGTLSANQIAQFDSLGNLSLGGKFNDAKLHVTYVSGTPQLILTTTADTGSSKFSIAEATGGATTIAATGAITMNSAGAFSLVNTAGGASSITPGSALVVNGVLECNGLGFQSNTSRTVSNLYVSCGTSTISNSTDANLIFPGTTSIDLRMSSLGNTNAAPASGDGYATYMIGSNMQTINAGGNPIFANLGVRRLKTSGSGLTELANMWVDSAGTGATNNYSIHSAGLTRIDQGLLVNQVSLPASLLFDMSSTTKASRPYSQMTQTQRDAIASPSTGAIIFNTTTNRINVYNGTAWVVEDVDKDTVWSANTIGLYDGTSFNRPRKLIGTGAISVSYSGDTILVNSTTLKYNHTIFTPTTGGTVNLVNNQYNIINPAGALLALTVALPSSPANNDVVNIKFTQNVTTVTYSNGTVVDGITAPTAGGLTVLTYDSGTTSWY